MKTPRPICWTAYPVPTTQPRVVNARGSATDIARLISMSTTSSTRTSRRSGSIQFVTHVV